MSEPIRWPFARRERLGDEGVAALLGAQRDWKDDVLVTATDRFERRLVEEAARLRLELSEVRSAVTTQVKETESTLRDEIAATRFEILKWSFVFWIGQFVTFGSLLALLR